jgi:hypothetical protein
MATKTDTTKARQPRTVEAKGWKNLEPRTGHRKNEDGTAAFVQRQRVDRRTGTVVSQLDATSPQKRGVKGDGRWFLRCEEHGTVRVCANLADAKANLTHPEAWCEPCAALAAAGAAS